MVMSADDVFVGELILEGLANAPSESGIPTEILINACLLCFDACDLESVVKVIYLLIADGFIENSEPGMIRLRGAE